jgi:heme-degrading monooxygenase HmoA
MRRTFMYARVVTHKTRAHDRIERLRHQKEVTLPKARQVSGREGAVSLFDPDRQERMVISLWNSEADMIASKRNEEFVSSFPSQKYADGDVAIELFEVARADVRGGKHARVYTWQVKPGQVDDYLRHVHEVTLPTTSQTPGRTGVVVLVDRSSHRTLIVSLWETEAAMQASLGIEEHQETLPYRTYGESEPSVRTFEIEVAE